MPLFCSCGCKKVVKTPGRLWSPGHNPEGRRKHSILLQKKYLGKGNPFYGKRHPRWLLKRIGRKVSVHHMGKGNAFYGKHHTKASRLLMGIAMAKRLQAGWVPWHRKLFKRGCIRIWMRSSWEVKFAKWCHRRGLHWHFEWKYFKLSVGTYLPDFFVKEWNSYVEIKGAKLPAPMEKLETFTRETGLPLVVLFKDDLLSVGAL